MLVVYRPSYRTKTVLSASLRMSFAILICGLFVSDVIQTVFASPEPKKLTNEEVLKELGVEIKMKGKMILTCFPIKHWTAIISTNQYEYNESLIFHKYQWHTSIDIFKTISKQKSFAQSFYFIVFFLFFEALWKPTYLKPISQLTGKT